MIVVDSSAWIEVFTRGERCSLFRAYLESGDVLLTPTVVLYEVAKLIQREASERAATIAIAKLKETVLVPLDESLALAAATVSLRYGLAMADAIVYATAQARRAVLVTGDAHFRGLPGVEFIEPPGEDAALGGDPRAPDTT